MCTIEVLVGMIGSGKSTYARRRADEGAMIVCHDELTGMLHGRPRYEQKYRELYRKSEEKLVEILLSNEIDVIIDRTHLTYESRTRWTNFANRCLPRPRIIAVKFPVGSPEVHAIARYKTDDRGRSLAEWLAVAKHHHTQAIAEPLDSLGGFDEIVEYVNLFAEQEQ
jgi:predicted kinase